MAGYTDLSMVRVNYSEECEKGVNDQINLELSAMYTYLSMSAYYDRADVALPNFAKYFKKCAYEELEHAQKFVKYQNKRGGLLVLKAVPKPEMDEWGRGVEGMKAALALERKVFRALNDLRAKCDVNNDYEMADFLEANFLHEQVEAIKELGGHVTNLKRVGDVGHGEYHFDRASLDD